MYEDSALNYCFFFLDPELYYYFIKNNNIFILARLCWLAASKKQPRTTATRCGLLKVIEVYLYRYVFFYIRYVNFQIRFVLFLLFIRGPVFIFLSISFLLFKGTGLYFSVAGFSF